MRKLTNGTRTERSVPSNLPNKLGTAIMSLGVADSAPVSTALIIVAGTTILSLGMSSTAARDQRFLELVP